MSNLYYDPEDFGFEIFEAVEDDESNYDYNTFLVLMKKDDKRLFWVNDSGCSCPMPFEDKSVTDLLPIVDMIRFNEDFEQWRLEFTQRPRVSEQKRDELFAKVKQHLEENNASIS